MANNIPAVYGLNKYLWHLISQDVMDASSYSNLVPIIPNGEAPTFLQMLDELPGVQSRPYIVYTWYTNGYDANSWYKPTDSVLYTVYALDQTKLNEIVMFIVNLFKRFDLSAQAVNTYIQTTPMSTDTALDAQYKAYNYSYINVASATGGVAPTLENDPISATVTLRVNYTNTFTDVPLP